MTPLEFSRLLSALITVESSNLPNPPPGDGGRAIGPLQIHPGVVQDVNRVYGWRFSHAQMTNREISKLVAYGYLRHWGARVPNGPSPEALARIWNGGPNGWKEKSTLPYWHKVQRVLDHQPRRAP